MSENPHSLEKDIHAESNSSIIATGFDERITGLANDYPTGTARFLGFYENIIQEHERKLRQSNLEHLIKGTSEAGFKTYSVSDFFSKATSPLTVFYPGAVAAYSLRDLKANDGSTTVVRVRRDSDNDEKDFTARQIESGEMVNWVNAQIVPPLDIGVLTDDGRVSVPDGGTSIGTPSAAYSLRSLGSNQWAYGGDTLEYESDFSAGVDGWYVRRGTGEFNITQAGRDGCLKFTTDSQDGEHMLQKSATVPLSSWCAISYEIFYPSSNVLMKDNIRTSVLGAFYQEDAKTPDVWHTIEISGLTIGDYNAGNNQIRIKVGPDGLGNGTDVFYIRNVKVYKSIGDTEYLPSGKYAVQVRRSSDDAVKSFTAAEVADGTLEDWVNEDVVKYTSDFSVDIDWWGKNGGTVNGNVDGIGGRDDCLSFVDDGLAGFHASGRTGMIIGSTMSATVDIYFPSTNALWEGFEIRHQGATNWRNTSYHSLSAGQKDTWLTVTIPATVADGTTDQFQVIPIVSGSNNFTGNGTDVFYIRNVRITQTSADGHVSTWYDQSGNDNHATQTDPANQPKIVEGGNILKDSNNNPALDFDGDADHLNFTSIPAKTVIACADAEPSGDSYLVGRGASDGALRADSLAIYRNAELGSAATNDFSRYGTMHLNGQNSTFDARNQHVVFATSGASAFNLSSVSASFMNRGWGGSIQEIIIYNSDQSANRTAIEANIGEYYGITGIPAYDNTVNGFVETWYDQSGVQVTETLAKGDIGNGNLDTAGSPTFDGWGNYKAGTTTIERDTVNQRSGLSCCKITLDGSSSNGFIYKAGLISGEVYRVSCWAKSDDGGKLLMDINNPSDPDAVFVLTSDWVKYERYAVSDGTNLTLGRQFTSSAGSTILIDDVEIEQLNKLPNDAIQSTASKQPKVVDAGVLVTDANGNVALDFDGVDDYIGNVDLDVFSTAPGTNNTFIFVSSQGGGASANETFIGPNAGTGGISASSVWFIWLNTGASDITYGTADTNPNLHFVYLPVSGTSAFGAVNGVVDATIDTTLSSVAEGFNIGKSPSGGGQDYLGGAMSEVIIYNSDQSANRTAIETNIANHYGITLS